MGSAGFSDSLATRVSPVEVIVIKGECPGASASCGTRTRSPDPQIKYAPGRWMSFQLISCKRELRWSDDEVCPVVTAIAILNLLLFHCCFVTGLNDAICVTEATRVVAIGFPF